MSKFKVNHITSKSGKNGPVLAGITTVSSTGSMRIPSGPTEQRGGRGRAIFSGGYEVPANTKEIQTIEIATTGNGSDFGDLAAVKQATGSCASATRGVVAGGAPGPSATIEYITMSSQGGASDFGSLTQAKRSLCGSGNDTRGVFFGGNNPARNRDIDFITIASTGNANEFGELGVNAGLASNLNDDGGSCSSPTRAFMFGGGNTTNVIQYITIATKGDSQDYGDLSQGNVRFPAGCSSSTRGLSGGGQSPSNDVNIIEQFTMATLGNATNFGDLTDERTQPAAASSKTRGVWAGGYDSPTAFNIIDYVTIASAGNATDFGDLTYSGQTNGASKYFSGCSDVNGGLGG